MTAIAFAVCRHTSLHRMIKARPLHNCHFPVMRRQATNFILEIPNVFLRLKFSPSLPDEKMSRYAKVSKHVTVHGMACFLERLGRNP